MGAPTPVGSGEGAVVSTCMRANAHTKFGRVRPHPTRACQEALAIGTRRPGRAIGTRRPGRASPTHFEAEARVQRRAERLHVCLLLGSALRSEMAISGNQWQSVAISGHQWPSVTTASGYQRGNQWQSPAERGGKKGRPSA